MQFRFTDVPAASARWWLVITPGDTDVCDEDPGHDVDVTVSTTLATMTRVWRGDVPWTAVQKHGELDVAGPSALRRDLPSWFRLSTFAGVPRPQAGAVTRADRGAGRQPVREPVPSSP